MRRELSRSMFGYVDYYSIKKDHQILDDKYQTYLQPTLRGNQLLAQYYEKKYQTKITFGLSLPDGTVEKFCGEACNNIFLEQLTQHFTQAKIDPNANYREMFYVISNASQHATPILYVQEKDKRYLLALDSCVPTKFLTEDKAEVEGIGEIKIYGDNATGPAGRQADHFSCFVDAVVMGCKMTKKDKDGTYIIPLDTIKFDEDKHTVSDLPLELLVTAQRSKWYDLALQGRAEDTAVHTHDNKPETLKQIRTRYCYNVERTDNKTGKKTLQENHYLRIKGLKYGIIIQTQYYINLLKATCGDAWTEEMETKFCQEAKAEFKGHAEYIKGLQDKGHLDTSFTYRLPVLHDLAVEYEAKLGDKTNITPSKLQASYAKYYNPPNRDALLQANTHTQQNAKVRRVLLLVMASNAALGSGYYYYCKTFIPPLMQANWGIFVCGAGAFSVLAMFYVYEASPSRNQALCVVSAGAATVAAHTALGMLIDQYELVLENQIYITCGVFALGVLTFAVAEAAISLAR